MQERHDHCMHELKARVATMQQERAHLGRIPLPAAPEKDAVPTNQNPRPFGPG